MRNMTDIPSTLKEPRYRASCKHCNTTMMSYTWQDLINHLSEHEIGIHFEDVSVITYVLTEEDKKTCDECKNHLTECVCRDEDDF